MKQKTTTTPTRGTDWLRPMRYMVRVPLLVVHLVINLPILLLTFNPIGAKIRVSQGERFDHWMIRGWSYWLMRIFGFQIVRKGEPIADGNMFVANHIGWMDIQLLHSQRMMCFVAKSEIANWPLIGWLAQQGGTIFHRRGNTESLNQVGQVMAQRLRDGLNVAAFPEGGTGPGDRVRTFHARIFQAAVDSQKSVQPVALKFIRDGEITTAIAFRDHERFVHNFFRVLGERSVTVEVHFLEALHAPFEGRRRIAEFSRAQIVAALGFNQLGNLVDSAAAAENSELEDFADSHASS